MIERNIPRDIAKYETKLLGPFTTRQIVCMVPGFGLAIGAYFLFKDSLGELALFVSVCLAIPFLLAGWWKPYGIPFEKYFINVFIRNFLSPTKRKYKTECVGVEDLEEEINIKVIKNKNKSRSKNPDFKELK